MDVLRGQIKLYENLIQNYTEYVQCLKNQLLEQSKQYENDSEILETKSDINDDQDMIWQRIRQAHLGDSHLGDSQNASNIKQEKLGYAENNIESEELAVPESNRDVKKGQTITRLSKFTTLKQNQIIKNIFIRARENMKILAELDKNILDNMEENVNKEADRILEVYLNEGGDYEN